MPLALPLLIGLFVVLPLTEVAIFIKVGSVLGVVPTLALTVACMVVGAVLVRRQGLDTLRQVQRSLDQGVVPVLEVLDGAMLLIAGVLLVTPGLLTDAAGVILLVPSLRRALGRAFLGGPALAAIRAQRRDAAIETDYRDVTPPRDRWDH